MSVMSASHQRFESVRSRGMSGGRGLRLRELPNRAHRERWDHRRERPFKTHLCGDPKGLRLLPLRSRAAVVHLSGPGGLPSRVTGLGGAWGAIGGRKGFGQPDFLDQPKFTETQSEPVPQTSASSRLHHSS